MNIKIIFLITIITVINTSYGNTKTIFLNQYVIVIEDETKELPTQKDFKAYLKSLRGVIKFCFENKEDIDINLAFGLFLVHVNLQTVLHRKYKSLPKDLAQELKGMSESVEVLLDFFRTMVIKDNDPADQNRKGIAALFWDETPWVERVQDLSRPSTLDNSWQDPRFHSWEDYQRAMTDLNDMAMPGPEESDICLSSLAFSSVNQTAHTRICGLHPACFTILREGSDYGYSLTHRLLLLLFAQFGRDCYIFSPEEHQGLVRRFCSIAYGEAQYIVENNFGNFIDLFMEQISVCSIGGFGQFVRRSWLSTILKHQQAEGCFGQTESRDHRPMQQKNNTKRRWVLEKNDSLDSNCNGHLTAVAAGAISAGVRLFLETVS